MPFLSQNPISDAAAATASFFFALRVESTAKCRALKEYKERSMCVGNARHASPGIIHPMFLGESGTLSSSQFPQIVKIKAQRHSDNIER
jgi:hypothetical protein